jgi:hypothetical protein
LKLEFTGFNTNRFHDELIQNGINPSDIIVTSLGDKTWVEFSDIRLEVIINNVSFNHNPLSALKENKIKEFSGICNKEILEGFNSSAKNGEQHYNFSHEDQINMLGLFTAVTIGGEQFIEWKNSSQPICEIWTAEEFLVLYNNAMTYKATKIRKFHELRVEILETTTKEELDNIVWYL